MKSTSGRAPTKILRTLAASWNRAAPLSSVSYSSSPPPRSAVRILKFREFLQEHQVDTPVGPLRCLASSSSAMPLQVFAIGLVHFFAEDEGDQIGILLDGAGFAQIAQSAGGDRRGASRDARLNCESTSMGTFSSLASSFRPREMALISWLRFSKRPRPLINCR